MIRVLYLAILVLPLCAFECSGPEGKQMFAAVFPEAAKNAALVLGEEVEAVALVEPVVEPEPVPPPCENYVWRGVVYACDGTWVRDL